jgi:hypothetical protein
MAEGDNPHQHQQRWNESPTDSWRREMRELIHDARTDFRERIGELKMGMTDLKVGMNDRLGPMEREIGELRAGKADRSEVAPKQVANIVYGLCAIVLVGFATVAVNYFIQAPMHNSVPTPSVAKP